MKTVRTAKGIPFLSTFVLSSLSNIPFKVATFLSSSPMMGNSSPGPLGERASMSFTQPEWEETLFAESPDELDVISSIDLR